MKGATYMSPVQSDKSDMSDHSDELNKILPPRWGLKGVWGVGFRGLTHPGQTLTPLRGLWNPAVRDGILFTTETVVLHLKGTTCRARTDLDTGIRRYDKKGGSRIAPTTIGRRTRRPYDLDGAGRPRAKAVVKVMAVPMRMSQVQAREVRKDMMG